ncbi:unnamed protein product [Rhodiola kirilowii]
MRNTNASLTNTPKNIFQFRPSVTPPAQSLWPPPPLTPAALHTLFPSTVFTSPFKEKQSHLHQFNKFQDGCILTFPKILFSFISCCKL